MSRPGPPGRLMASMKASVPVLACLALLCGCVPAFERSMRAGDEALHDGFFAEARAAYGQAAQQAAAAGAASTRRVRARKAEAAAALLMGQPALAEASYRAALKELKAGSAAARELARALAQIAAVVAVQGRAEEAAALYRQCVEEHERAGPPYDSELPARLMDLGQLELARRRFPEAEKAYARALALREAAAGREHPSLAPLLQDLAAAYQGQGKSREADDAGKRAGLLGSRK
jgi:hypothetical protein